MISIITVIGLITNVYINLVISLNSKLEAIALSGPCVYGVCPGRLISRVVTPSITNTMATPQVVLTHHAKPGTTVGDHLLEPVAPSTILEPHTIAPPKPQQIPSALAHSPASCSETGKHNKEQSPHSTIHSRQLIQNETQLEVVASSEAINDIGTSQELQLSNSNASPSEPMLVHVAVFLIWFIIFWLLECRHWKMTEARNALETRVRILQSAQTESDPKLLECRLRKMTEAKNTLKTEVEIMQSVQAENDQKLLAAAQSLSRLEEERERFGQPTIDNKIIRYILENDKNTDVEKAQPPQSSYLSCKRRLEMAFSSKQILEDKIVETCSQLEKTENKLNATQMYQDDTAEAFRTLQSRHAVSSRRRTREIRALKAKILKISTLKKKSEKSLSTSRNLSSELQNQIKQASADLQEKIAESKRHESRNEELEQLVAITEGKLHAAGQAQKDAEEKLEQQRSIEDDNRRRLSSKQKEMVAAKQHELDAVKSAMHQELDVVKKAKQVAEGKFSEMKSTSINLQAEAATIQQDLSRQIGEEKTGREQAERDIQVLRISLAAKDYELLNAQAATSNVAASSSQIVNDLQMRLDDANQHLHQERNDHSQTYLNKEAMIWTLKGELNQLQGELNNLKSTSTAQQNLGNTNGLPSTDDRPGLEQNSEMTDEMEIAHSHESSGDTQMTDDDQAGQESAEDKHAPKDPNATRAPSPAPKDPNDTRAPTPISDLNDADIEENAKTNSGQLEALGRQEENQDASQDLHSSKKSTEKRDTSEGSPGQETVKDNEERLAGEDERDPPAVKEQGYPSARGEDPLDVVDDEGDVYERLAGGATRR